MWGYHKIRKLNFMSILKNKKSNTRVLNSVLISRRNVSRSIALSASSSELKDKHIFPSIYSDIIVPDIPITQFLFDAQEKFAGKISLISSETGQSWTHDEVRTAIIKLASALSRMGVVKGDTVALISPNCPEYAIAMCAVVHLGGIISTFSVSYTPNEISHQLKNSDSSYVICHEDKLRDTVEAIKDNKNIRRTLCIGKEEQGIVSIHKLIKDDDGKGIPNQIPINTSEDVAVLPYSSGTTGLPKGVMITHRNIVANILQVLHPDTNILRYATDDFQEKFVGLLPMYHIFGMVCCMCHSIVTGSQLITFKEFNPHSFLNTITKFQISKLHLVPPIVSFLNTSELANKDTLASVTHIVCGAAPLGKSVLDAFFKKFGSEKSFLEGYGMTETSPVTHLSKKDNFIIGSCGAALANTWSKIIDVDNGQPVKIGEEGELCLKGPQVMKGYYNNEKATRETIDEEGWLHTGDMARMDEEENLYIVDRLKELIKVKGLQVAPAELENLLRKHPLIEDVAVTSIPDEKSGELPRAFVVPKSGQIVTENEIKEFVSSKVARHKHLDGGVIFVKEIPKSAAGKILRRQLKKIG